METQTNKSISSAEQTAAAFGLSASITVVFNVLLAFVKDSYPPLNAFMTQLTGHHWRTHGLADVILFVLLGLLFMNQSRSAKGMTDQLVVTVTAASIGASVLLGLWFVFF